MGGVNYLCIMVSKEIKIKLLQLDLDQAKLAVEYGGCSPSLISKALNGKETYPKLVRFLEDRLGITLIQT